MPIPTLRVSAPPVVTLRSDSSATLQASAKLPICFESTDIQIEYTWKNTASVHDSGAVGPILDLAVAGGDSRFRRSLQLQGSYLTPKTSYTLRVEGCMRGTTVCGFASVDVALADEPLRGAIAGGDRSVGEDSPLVVDGCDDAFFDPDDLDAPLSFTWACSAAPEASTLNETAWQPCSLPPPSTSCKWSLPGGTLSAQFAYMFSVTVSKPDGEAVDSSVLIQVESGVIPSVGIGQLPGKQNPTDRLVVSGVAAMEGQGVGNESSLRLLWSIDDSRLSLMALSTTGVHQNMLVLRPGSFQPGASYLLTLSATYKGRVGRSSALIVMNSPPFGGSCVYTTPTTPVVSLGDPVTVLAKNWVDDESDMPLTYSFGFVAAGSQNQTVSPLGQRSMNDKATWEAPDEGSWDMICNVFDAFQARAVATVFLEVQEGQAIDSGKAQQIMDRLAGFGAEGNLDSMSQMGQTTGAALAKQSARRRRRRLSEGGDSASRCAAAGSDPEAQQSADLRTDVLVLLHGAQQQQSTDPGALLASTNALGSLGSDPCELGEDAQEAGAQMLESIVSKAGEAGTFAAGAPDAMLKSMGSVLSATLISASAALNASRSASLMGNHAVGENWTTSMGALNWRRLSEEMAVNGSPNASRNVTSAQQLRAQKLAGSANQLASHVMKGQLPGEERIAYGGNGIGTSLQIAYNPAGMEGAAFRGAAVDGQAPASITVPTGTLCSPEDQVASLRRRLAVSRRGRRQMQGTAAAAQLVESIANPP